MAIPRTPLALLRGAARLLPVAAVLAAAQVLAPRALAADPAPVAPPSPLSILADWQWDPSIVVPVLVSAAIYLWLVRRVDRLHPAHRWPWYRTAMFLAALGLLWIALLSPIDSVADDLGSIHMIQHMLLLMAVAPLLAASGPITLLLRASSHSVRERRILPILNSRIIRLVTYPPLDWVGLAVVLWATHFSVIYNEALLNQNVHDAEHLAYLVFGCLFWWPVCSPDPLHWRMGPVAKIVYVFLQIPQMSFLAVAIMMAPRLLYEAYATRTIVYGVSPMADQSASGAIMWVTGDMMFVVQVLIVIAFWMRDDDAATRREDARLDRLMALEAQAGADGYPSGKD